MIRFFCIAAALFLCASANAQAPSRFGDVQDIIKAAANHVGVSEPSITPATSEVEELFEAGLLPDDERAEDRPTWTVVIGTKTMEQDSDALMLMALDASCWMKHDLFNEDRPRDDAKVERFRVHQCVYLSLFALEDGRHVNMFRRFLSASEANRPLLKVADSQLADFLTEMFGDKPPE